MFPLTKASPMLEGMMFSRKPVTPSCCARCGVAGDGLDVERGGIDVHAAAGMEQVDGDQAHQQRDGGDDFKVDERLGADAAYLSDVAHAGDADDDGGEDDRARASCG